MRHREERAYRIDIRLAAEFDESYQGEEDGYEWHARFERVVQPRLVRAVIDALRADPGWRVTETPRGESDTLALTVERVV